MSVRIYKIGGSGATTGVLKGVHSLITISIGQTTSQSTESSANTTHTMTANVVHTAPFIPNQNVDMGTAFINCTTLAIGGLARIMVYDDVNGLPNNLLANSANIDISTTGVKTTTLKYSFSAGTTYWLAVQSNSSTAILSALPVANLLCLANNPTTGAPYSIYTASGTFASGAESTFGSYTSPAYASTPMPFVGINAA
jgi:hypothetical protein